MKRKTAIVMGASSGLGEGVARRLAQRGWRVGIAARRGDRLDAIKRVFPDGVIETHVIDINSATAEKQFNRLVDKLGGIDLYFHASGIGWQNAGLDPDKELATVQTNALGFTRMVTAAFNRMARDGGGHIAVISSVAGTKGLGPAPSYSATKAFNSTYIQALEQLSHMRKLGITFTDVRPGFVSTPLLQGADYPMLMDVDYACDRIVRAVLSHRHVAIIDWRYRLLVAAWRRIPRWLWRRFPLGRK